MELNEFIKLRNIIIRDNEHLRVIKCFYPYLRSVSGDEHLLPSALEKILGIDLTDVSVVTACFNGVNDGSKPPYDNVDLYIKFTNGIKVFVYGRKEEIFTDLKENEYVIFLLSNDLSGNITHTVKVHQYVILGEKMNILMRKAKLGDEKILAYIQTESWKSAFVDIISAEDMERCTDIVKAEAMYENVLKSGYAEMSILEIDSKPHCIAAWSKARNPQFSDCAEIICIHSLSENRGKGYGSMMMNHIIDEIKNSGYNNVLLWVFEKNTRARRFYEKHGFELTDNTQISYDAVEVMYRKELYRI
ncbi:MAG: GNAT family N-acetyltransferase [Clostridia bacterium]|nr:GNAT family N-acetyltransferase [Clostridia bacterium]